eukprot:774563-Prorocentrum_minimum.AAC.1
MCIRDSVGAVGEEGGERLPRGVPEVVAGEVEADHSRHHARVRQNLPEGGQRGGQGGGQGGGQHRIGVITLTTRSSTHALALGTRGVTVFLGYTSRS